MLDLIRNSIVACKSTLYCTACSGFSNSETRTLTSVSTQKLSEDRFKTLDASSVNPERAHLGEWGEGPHMDAL